MQSNHVSYHGGPKVPTPTLFILTYWGIMCPSTAELYIDAIAVINCTKEHLYQLWVYCIGVSLPEMNQTLDNPFDTSEPIILLNIFVLNNSFCHFPVKNESEQGNQIIMPHSVLLFFHLGLTVR